MDENVVQIDCIKCDYFDKNAQRCSIEKGSPIRSCIIGINNNFCKNVANDSKILEVGCGSWSYLRNILPDTTEWYGIDVIDDDIVSKIGSVGDIPYDSNRFDYVISNQSMEHWHEFGVPLQRGMSEISRVLKSGGEAWLNIPIHLHGHSIFINGREKDVIGIVNKNHWKVKKIEEWRKNHEPLDPYYPYDDFSRSNDAFPGRPSTWIMNIVIEKKSTQTTSLSTYFKYQFDSRISKIFHRYEAVPHYHHVLNNLRVYDSKYKAIKKLWQRFRNRSRE